VGVLGLERAPARCGARDRRLAEGMSEVLALSIDNARWFGRLTIVGADKERGRLARDLHDRLGQWLTFIKLEVDRIQDECANPAMAELQAHVGTAIAELRETLCQLRTTIDEQTTFADAAAELLERA